MRPNDFAVARPRAPSSIGVLTFDRCINYGSYWQARCLLEGLRARGFAPVLLGHRSAEVEIAEYRNAYQPTLPRRTSRADFPAYKAKARAVLRAADALPRSAPFPLTDPQAMPAFDLVLVGSDEVWNARHPWYGGARIFYGAGVRATRLASYAASFGNHDAAEGLEDWWAEQLGRFDAISVRDDNSRDIVRKALGVEPALVLDPCLQFPPTVPPPGEDAERPYLAVYGTGFPDWYASAVRAHAARHGLRVISLGYRNAWADEQRIAIGPEEWAALIAGARAVATNFFHGCVFALLNAKPFACVSSPYRANKVRDLMRKVGAEAHLTNEAGTDGIGALLGTPMDPAIGTRIAALRQSSNAYLDRVLG